MPVLPEAYHGMLDKLPPTVTLVAVSKTKPREDIATLHTLGQRDFGENYVQELLEKQPLLPQDIRWHFIGHLQSNKVKYLVPFIHLIQGVDSYDLLKEINKQAAKVDRTIDCLLQVHIAREETKFGFDANECKRVLDRYIEERDRLLHVRVRGLMGMASNDRDDIRIREEFDGLKKLFDRYKERIPSWDILSMGMSSDVTIAIEAGSTMVRIGSLLFGIR